MDLIKNMSVNIIVACVVSVLIEFLVPIGKMSKIMHSILCLFVICVLILPVTGKSKMLNFDEVFDDKFDGFNQNLEFSQIVPEKPTFSAEKIQSGDCNFVTNRV